MVSQVQTPSQTESYTESVPVTTMRQVVEEQGGYELRSVPVTTTVPVAGCAPGDWCWRRWSWRTLLPLRRRRRLRPQVRSSLRRRLRPVRRCGRRCWRRCRRGRWRLHHPDHLHLPAGLRLPAGRSIVPETTYVNQTRTRQVPVQQVVQVPVTRTEMVPVTVNDIGPGTAGPGSSKSRVTTAGVAR